MQLKIGSAALLYALVLGITLQTGVARRDHRDPGLSWRGDTLYLNQSPFSGVEVERYPDGTLSREVQYLNGRQEGLEKRYSLNGRLRSIFSFRNGRKDGEQKGWFEDGAKMFVSRYQEGRFEGEQTEWHQNGVVFRRQLFHDGVEVDKKILFQRGEIFTNYAKREGRTFGIDGGTLCFERKRDGER